MAMRSFVQLTVIPMAAAVLAACAPANENKVLQNERPLNQVYRLIDAQRSDEAITLAEQLVDSNSSDREAKVALASAYAHRAGIKIQGLAQVVSASKNSSILASTPQSSIALVLNPGQKIDSTLTDSTLILSQILKVSQIYTSIPNIDLNGRTYLQLAIRTIDRIDDVNQTEAIYRAVLRIVLFKHLLATELLGDIERPNNLEKSCLVDLNRLNDSILNLGRTLINIMADISIAHPDQEKSLNIQRAAIADAVSKLTIVTTSLIVIDEASNLLLKQSLIQRGLGKAIQCKGADINN
jgi:hypothetical protein